MQLIFFKSTKRATKGKIKQDFIDKIVLFDLYNLLVPLTR